MPLGLDRIAACLELAGTKRRRSGERNFRSAASVTSLASLTNQKRRNKPMRKPGDAFTDASQHDAPTQISVAVNEGRVVIAEKTSAVVGYGGSGTAVIFGLSASQWQVIGVIGGLCIGLAGFAFNAWLGWRRDQREERGKL